MAGHMRLLDIPDVALIETAGFSDDRGCTAARSSGPLPPK
jgi:hypothetical protein